MSRWVHACMYVCVCVCVLCLGVCVGECVCVYVRSIRYDDERRDRVSAESAGVSCVWEEGGEGEGLGKGGRESSYNSTDGTGKRKAALCNRSVKEG